MRVLVTGAAGLIGANLCRYLLDNVSDIFIIMIDNLSGNFESNLPISPRAKFLKLDLSIKEDQELIEQEFKNEYIDYIYHFQSYAAECVSAFMRQFNYTQNTLTTAFMINCGINYNIKRFIFSSSNSVYGFQEKLPFDETMTNNPQDPYAISKFCCEMDLQVAKTQHNMDYSILRLHNVFGKYQYSERYRNVLMIFMRQSRNKEKLTIYGDGKQIRSFTYIDNILPCLLKAATSDKAKNQIINLGGKNDNSLNEMADLIIKITGHKAGVVHLEPRHEVKVAWATVQKSIDLLDYSEDISLEEGLKYMWEWYKTEPLREIKSFDKYEVNKGIYSYWKLQK